MSKIKKEDLGQIIIIIAILLLIGGFAYGCFKAERWWNWKFSYGPQVQKELEPLEKRIDGLEIRLKKLEGVK